MRKMIMFLGTILIAAVIIISGSAVATWVYVAIIDSNQCTGINDIDNAPDSYHATLGQTGIPPSPDVLGSVRLDLGASNGMPPNQQFTVFSDTFGVSEDYEVFVGTDLINLTSVGSADDQGDQNFYAPDADGPWRYIIITGTSGSTGGSDTSYGPEIDAVGWDKP